MVSPVPRWSNAPKLSTRWIWHDCGHGVVGWLHAFSLDPCASLAAFSGIHAGTAIRGPSLVDGFNPSHDGGKPLRQSQKWCQILKNKPKNIPNSNNYLKKSTKVCGNDVWKLLEINRDKTFIDHLSGTTNFAWTPVLGHLACKSVPRSFASELLLGNRAWEPVPGNLLLGTCSWHLSLETLRGNLAWKSALGNLFLGTFGNLWEPVPGNLFLGTLLRNLAWEPALWNLASKPVLGNFWEPWEPVACVGTLLRNLFLGTQEPLEIFRNLFLGTLLWEPCLAICCWGPFGTLGNLFGNLAWGPCLETWLGNLALGDLFLETCFREPCLGNLGKFGELFLGTLGTLVKNLAWEPLPGNLAWQPLSGNLCVGTFETLLGNLAWKPFCETLLGNLDWEPRLGTWLGNLAWEPCLETSSWEPRLATFSWEPCLGTCSWEPCLGTPSWEPGNLAQCDFGCSDLLRDLYYGWRPQAYAVGEKCGFIIPYDSGRKILQKICDKNLYQTMLGTTFYNNYIEIDGSNHQQPLKPTAINHQPANPDTS